MSGINCWLLRLKLSRVEVCFHFVCKTAVNFIILNFCFCSFSKGIFDTLRESLYGK